MSALSLGLMLLQTGAAAAGLTGAPAGPHAYPFRVGERFVYSAKLGLLNLGEGTMSVAAIDTLRGAESFRFEFTLIGGLLTFDLNDTLRSWTGTADFVSRRFYQKMDEDGKVRIKQFDIFPDSGHYTEVGRPTRRPTGTDPLDDTAFFYFMRLVPLEVGKTYEFNNYFRRDRNPVRIKVEKRETMELPDGSKVATLVLHPIIEERGGMFSKRANARVWFTDDARRIPVQIRSRFVFGTVTLRLKEMILPEAPTTPPPTRP